MCRFKTKQIFETTSPSRGSLANYVALGVTQANHFFVTKVLSPTTVMVALIVSSQAAKHPVVSALDTLETCDVQPGHTGYFCQLSRGHPKR